MNQQPVVSALIELPGLVHVLVPELRQLGFREEPRSDCSCCPLLPANTGVSPDCDWCFNPDTRCCTHHPWMPNFMLGRALLRQGRSSNTISERLWDRSNVNAWGVGRSEGYVERYHDHGWDFGKRESLRCPYWVGGTYACGVWEDRSAVCRTWFCKHDAGGAGRDRWDRLRSLLEAVEERIAQFCVSVGEPPISTATLDDWIRWFTWCAGRVEQVTEAEVQSLRSSHVDDLRADLVKHMTTSPPQLTDVVVPVVSRATTVEDSVYLVGYTKFDVVKSSPSVVHFFAQLDGKTSWQTALANARGRCDTSVDEELVRELFRIDVLQPPHLAERGPGTASLPRGSAAAGETARDKGVPDVLMPSVNLPIVARNTVWLQGTTSLRSTVLPLSVFAFLSRLDGRRPWRVAYDEALAETRDSIDEALVYELFRIGVLIEPSE